MSLIEQLGGYERANNIARNYSNDRDRVIQCSSKDIEYTGDPSEIANINLVEFAISDLRSAVLKYRREHSLFEVGDLVTHLTTRDILKVISIEDSNKHYRFIKVKAINPKNQESVNEFNSLWFQLKHATDEEVEAGRRLND